MHQAEVWLRTKLVALKRDHLLQLLDMSKEILAHKQQTDSAEENRSLWLLFEEVANDIEAAKRKMMEYSLDDPLIKVVPLPN